MVKTGRDHGSKTYRSNEHVNQEYTEGTSIVEGGCCSEEETGTDDTTNTGSTGQLERWNCGAGGYLPDHSNMTALQLAAERGVNRLCFKFPLVAALPVVGGHDGGRRGFL